MLWDTNKYELTQLNFDQSRLIKIVFCRCALDYYFNNLRHGPDKHMVVLK